MRRKETTVVVCCFFSFFFLWRRLPAAPSTRLTHRSSLYPSNLILLLTAKDSRRAYPSFFFFLFFSLGSFFTCQDQSPKSRGTCTTRQLPVCFRQWHSLFDWRSPWVSGVKVVTPFLSEYSRQRHHSVRRHDITVFALLFRRARRYVMARILNWLHLRQQFHVRSFVSLNWPKAKKIACPSHVCGPAVGWIRPAAGKYIYLACSVVDAQLRIPYRTLANVGAVFVIWS